jgi:hypothetical protein
MHVQHPVELKRMIEETHFHTGKKFKNAHTSIIAQYAAYLITAILSTSLRSRALDVLH